MAQRQALSSDSLKALADRRKKTRKTQTITAKGKHSEPGKPTKPDLCGLPGAEAAPSNIVNFHQLADLALEDSWPGEPVLACTMTDRLSLALSLDLEFRQDWYWRDERVGELAATLTLAPCEQLKLRTAKRRRRVVAEQSTRRTEQVSSRERASSTKATTNVTETTTARKNWSISSTGTVGVPVANLSVTGSIGGEVSEVVGYSTNQIAEESLKSSDQLRSLEEIVIKTTTEEQDEEEQQRLIDNPYADRSLLLKIFTLLNEYRIDTTYVAWRPAICFQFDHLRLDDAFVLSNSDFLEGVLLDRSLAMVIPDVIQEARDVVPTSNVEEIQRITSLAMTTLLDQDDGVFAPTGTGNRYRVSASLNAAIDDFENTGLYDSSTNGVGRGFAAIVAVASWRTRDQADLANGTISAAEVSRRELQYTIGLAEAIRPEWIALDREHVRNIFDQSDNTEVLRRIPGFLSIVDSMLKPLLGQTGRALQVQQSAEGETPPTIWYEDEDPLPREARHLLSLLTSHIHCYEAFYRRQYLAHLEATTMGSAFVTFVTQLLDATGVTAFFDFDAAYLEGDRWIVPFLARTEEEKEEVLTDIADALGITIDQNALDELEKIESSRFDEAIVPAEGNYLEAVAGSCILKGVGDHASVDLDLSITGKSRHGKGSNGRNDNGGNGDAEEQPRNGQ